MSDSKPTIGTSIKLNGSNYILWSRAFLLFLRSQKIRSHLPPPTAADANDETWFTDDDCSTMTWLLKSLGLFMNKNIRFLDTAKAMWDIFQEMYSNDKNISQVFELYEKISSTSLLSKDSLTRFWFIILFSAMLRQGQ